MTRRVLFPNPMTTLRGALGALVRGLIAVAVVGLAISPASADLLVTSYFTNSVLRYDGTTGAFSPFVTAECGGLGGPTELTFGPDGHLYVTSYDTNSVLRYDSTTGPFIDVFVPVGSGGLSNPRNVKFGSDGHLYVAKDHVATDPTPSAATTARRARSSTCW